MYRYTTSENSLVNFVVNPVYLDAQGKANKEFMPHAAEVWIDPKHISKHGWIVSGLKSRFFEAVPWIDDDDVKDTHHIEGYRQAVATGKVRLFYILNDEINCQDIEEYCIGVPYAFDAFDISIAATHDYSVFKYVNLIQEQPPAREASDLAATYGYGVYLLAWERMPADTHISAIFAMGDKCTEDIGAPGPDANTGLGRLDIGCMASEVYKVRLDPTVATLSVAARKPSSPVVSVVADTTTMTVSLMVVKETLTAAPKKNKVLAALSTEFSRLGIDTTTSRKENAYVIGHLNKNWSRFGGRPSFIGFSGLFSCIVMTGIFMVG